MVGREVEGADEAAEALAALDSEWELGVADCAADEVITDDGVTSRLEAGRVDGCSTMEAAKSFEDEIEESSAALADATAKGRGWIGAVG